MHEDVRCYRRDLVHQSRPVRSFTPAEPGVRNARDGCTAIAGGAVYAPQVER